jgi:hypothetical protein
MSRYSPTVLPEAHPSGFAAFLSGMAEGVGTGVGMGIKRKGPGAAGESASGPGTAPPSKPTITDMAPRAAATPNLDYAPILSRGGAPQPMPGQEEGRPIRTLTRLQHLEQGGAPPARPAAPYQEPRYNAAAHYDEGGDNPWANELADLAKRRRGW